MWYVPIPTFFKQAATPGSIGFLLASFVGWLVVRFLWPRSRRVASGWLLAVALIYLVLSVPWVANRIADRLMPPQPEQAAFAGALDRLVILDGDNRVGRIREAQRVYAIGKPREIDVLGDRWLVYALRVSGVPRDRIRREAGPSTTREQMEWVQHSIEPAAAPRTGLIVSRLQMPRVAALARTAGLSLVLLPANADAEPPTRGIRLYIPTYTALRVSRDALYEHAALAYYAWRRWIEPT
jgi:uncharacterized SAM-binding protein YcdF (DUF218 family)